MKIYNPTAYSCVPVRAVCKSSSKTTMSIDFLCVGDRDHDDCLTIIFDQVDQDRIRRACEAFNAIMVEADIEPPPTVPADAYAHAEG